MHRFITSSTKRHQDNEMSPLLWDGIMSRSVLVVTAKLEKALIFTPSIKALIESLVNF